MYIIRLLNGVEELSNASSFSRIGHQGDSLNLTMVQSVYCDQACKELLSCLRRSQVSTDVVEQLLWKQADPNATDLYGFTQLILACGQRHLEVVRCICDAGANKDQAASHGPVHGWTPLLFAS